MKITKQLEYREILGSIPYRVGLWGFLSIICAITAFFYFTIYMKYPVKAEFGAQVTKIKNDTLIVFLENPMYNENTFDNEEKVEVSLSGQPEKLYGKILYTDKNSQMVYLKIDALGFLPKDVSFLTGKKAQLKVPLKKLSIFKRTFKGFN